MLNVKKYITKEHVKNMLLKINFLIITVVVISNIAIFMTYFINDSLKKMQYSNDNLVKQIAISYETVVNSAKNTLIKFLASDEKLLQDIDVYSADVKSKYDIVKKLDEILVENDMIHSVYLYMDKTDEVAVVSRSYSTFSDIETFADKSAFEKAFNILFCDFVTRTDKKSQNVTMTLCVKIPSAEENFIAVNIDYADIYNAVMDTEPGKYKPQLVIYSDDDTIVYPLNGQVLPKGNKRRFGNYGVSQYVSQDLGMKFSLFFSNISESVLSPALFMFFIVTILIAVIVMFISKYILNAYLTPISHIIGEHAEQAFKNIIIGNAEMNKEVFESVYGKDVDVENVLYAVIIAETEKAIRRNIEMSALPAYIVNFETEKNKLCYVVSFTDFENAEEELNNISEKIYSEICDDEKAFVAVSMLKMGYISTASLYLQAKNALEYKIYSGEKVIYSSKLKISENMFEYDSQKERQLINNIVTGNYEGSILYLGKIFEDITCSSFAIDDRQIKSIMYRLQNAILKCIAGYPIPIRASTDNSLAEAVSAKDMYNEMSELIKGICDEINRKDENDKYRLYNIIMEYIEKNFTRTDISNTLIADEFNINKSYLSKIIKECTGESLPEYINKKRIELSKQLLCNSDLSIEKIAGNVGYNYSYYFIKTFKSLENITPGEYRKINKKQ